MLAEKEAPPPAYNAAVANGWERLFDQVSGREYFLNHNTRQSQWERPPELGGAAPAPGPPGGYGYMVPGQAQSFSSASNGSFATYPQQQPQQQQQPRGSAVMPTPPQQYGSLPLPQVQVHIPAAHAPVPAPIPMATFATGAPSGDAAADCARAYSQGPSLPALAPSLDDQFVPAPPAGDNVCSRAGSVCADYKVATLLMLGFYAGAGAAVGIIFAGISIEGGLGLLFLFPFWVPLCVATIAAYVATICIFAAPVGCLPCCLKHRQIVTPAAVSASLERAARGYAAVPTASLLSNSAIDASIVAALLAPTMSAAEAEAHVMALRSAPFSVRLKAGDGYTRSYAVPVAAARDISPDIPLASAKEMPTNALLYMPAAFRACAHTDAVIAEARVRVAHLSAAHLSTSTGVVTVAVDYVLHASSRPNPGPAPLVVFANRSCLGACCLSRCCLFLSIYGMCLVPWVCCWRGCTRTVAAPSVKQLYVAQVPM